MRPWLALALALLACAAWLALRGDSAAVAPALGAAGPSAHGVAVDGPGVLDPELRSVLDPGPAAERVVADAASIADARDASLSVRVLLPDGSAWAGGTLELASEAPAVDLRESRRRSRPAGPSVAVFDGRTHRLQVETDAAGRAQFAPIVPGVTFSLRAVDALNATGAELQSLALSEGERRELELRSAAPAALRGRCVDENGAALAGVEVHLAHGDWTLIAGCDESGRFETAPLFARALTLSARLRDRGACERRGVDPAAGPIELVLEQSRRLLVETVDADGEPVHGLQPTLHLGSEALPLSAEPTRTLRGWSFRELPGGPLTLRWGSPCRPQSMQVDGAATGVRVIDEPLGLLVIEVAPMSHAPDVEHFVAILCADGTTAAGEIAHLRDDRVAELRWDLAPGRYRVQRLASVSTEGSLPLGAALLVDVRADETTLARLED